MKKVCVIGLGYVGLPLLAYSQKAGYNVIGVDIDQNKISALKEHKLKTFDKEVDEEIRKISPKKLMTEPPKEFIDYLIICVPTPVKQNKTPDYTYLINAVKSISDRLNKHETVIVESTVSPGTVKEKVIPLLEKTGLKAGEDFYVAYCPERISPGDNWDFPKIRRVLGALNDKSSEKASEFYTKVLEKPPYNVNSIEVAELTKVYENMFRDINIAFVNEIAKVCDSLGIDVSEVIAAASTKPFGFMPFYPGIGVGGHCIPIDPYYLIEKVEREGTSAMLFRFARQINDSMVPYLIFKVYDTLNKQNLSLNRTKVSVLGVTYKPNIDDIRESPALRLISELKKRNAKVDVYDPLYTKINTLSSIQDIKGSEVIIFTVPHDAFKGIEEEILKSSAKVVIDCTNTLNKAKITSNGKKYIGIGR